MWKALVLVTALGWGSAAQGQWVLQDSGTKASFRGVHYVGGGVAWVSGTGGTVLRTVDMGKTWVKCAVPEGAEKLDFRGVQAWDAKTAVVMSSGPGEASRLYKTGDGCGTWKLVATNPDKEGFWDSVKFYAEGSMEGLEPANEALILGDTVQSENRLWEWKEGWEDRELELNSYVPKKSDDGEGSFAASNSVLQIEHSPQIDKMWNYRFRWASNTPTHTYITYHRDEQTPTCEPCRAQTSRVEVPMAGGSKGAGIFSFDFRTQMVGVAVGGDYSKPDAVDHLAAVTTDGGLSWSAPKTSPRGYRSAVAYDAKSKTWITVGPNGTDVSRDDGKNWTALKPGVGDAVDADKRWNALSLPFVVGERGRIGILNSTAMSAKDAKVSPL